MAKNITDAVLNIVDTNMTANIGVKNSEGSEDSYYTVEISLTQNEKDAILAILQTKI